MSDSSQNREYADGELVPGTPYRIVRMLGAGGMGLVYEVEHTLIERRFVLKSMLKSLADREDLVARMRNEWRALGRLSHENIVDVNYAGTSASGAPYYVMELLVGETLSRRMKRLRRLPYREASRIAREILLGLSVAHRVDVIHRDVKPANIFITQEEVVKVLDFGIAKVRDDSMSEMTAHGLAIGTPRYMSPEQVAGSSTTAQADLYAVGLLLFEMIAGRGPFDDVGGQREQMLAHISRTAPSLSGWAEIPEELGALVAGALAKEPSDRPASAEEMAEALLSFSGPRRPGVWERVAVEPEPSMTPRASLPRSVPFDSNESTLERPVSIPRLALPSSHEVTAPEPNRASGEAATSLEGPAPRTRTELLAVPLPEGSEPHDQPTRTSIQPHGAEELALATPPTVEPLTTASPARRADRPVRKLAMTSVTVGLVGLGTAAFLLSRSVASGPEENLDTTLELASPPVPPEAPLEIAPIRAAAHAVPLAPEAIDEESQEEEPSPLAEEAAVVQRVSPAPPKAPLPERPARPKPPRRKRGLPGSGL